MTEYIDDGKPENYYFAVDISPDMETAANGNPELVLFLCPREYFIQNNVALCEELAWQHPDFEQMQEASYVTSKFATPEDLCKWAILEGFIFKKTFMDLSNGWTDYMNVLSDMTYMLIATTNAQKAYAKPTQISKGQKITTKYLVDLMINELSKNELGEIFGSFDDRKEYNPKNWKRASKRKFALKDYDETFEGDWPSYEFEMYFNESNEYLIPVNKTYVNNTDNVVVCRIFELKEEDAQVVFLTDAKDQEIVGIIYHID